MRRIYDQYVIEYIPREYIGSKPTIFDRLTRNATYKSYRAKIAEIRDHLSGIEDVQELIVILTEEYGLPINRAREFVNKNVTREFRKADYNGKLGVLARANRGLLRVNRRDKNI